MSVAAIIGDHVGAGEPSQKTPPVRQGAGRVCHARQQAIASILRSLAPRVGRLSPARLRTITLTFATRPDLWADLVVHDPDVRWYLPLYRSGNCDVWLLAWERGQDTDWHDHGGSSGSFAVGQGSLLERYRTTTGRLGHRHLRLGRGAAFGPGHVHNVGHGGNGLAASIHCYSPPLVAMTYYGMTGYGLVARKTVPVNHPG